MIKIENKTEKKVISQCDVILYCDDCGREIFKYDDVNQKELNNISTTNCDFKCFSKKCKKHVCDKCGSSIITYTDEACDSNIIFCKTCYKKYYNVYGEKMISQMKSFKNEYNKLKSLIAKEMKYVNNISEFDKYELEYYIDEINNGMFNLNLEEFDHYLTEFFKKNHYHVKSKK